MTRAMMRWPAMCCAALLSACAATEAPPPAPRVERIRVPEPLLHCAPAPPLPAGPRLTQGQVAETLMRLDAAHADCTGKLAAIRRLQDAAP